MVQTMLLLLLTVEASKEKQAGDGERKKGTGFLAKPGKREKTPLQLFCHSITCNSRSVLKFNGHEFEQTQGDSEGQEAWRAAVHGVAKNQT